MTQMLHIIIIIIIVQLATFQGSTVYDIEKWYHRQNSMWAY